MAVLNNNTLAGSSGQTTGGGGYEIERSLRFNSADSAYLSKNFGSAGNRKTWTWAGWVKKSGLGSAQLLFARHTASNDAGFDALYFNSSDILVHSGWTSTYFNTTQVFRDPSAWLHVVWVVDVTQSTGSNRNKLYINGSLISDYSAYNDLTENADRPINDAALHKIGGRGDALNLNGYLADVHFIDGQALDPTSFGEFDDNGVWQPIEYTGSYNVGVGAVNGFHLDFADNSTVAALGTDAAGSNDWTPNNFSVTAGADNDSLCDYPTNGDPADDTGFGNEVSGNYATWNPLDTKLVQSNGNLDATASTSQTWVSGRGTIGVFSGKWYWEVTVNSVSSTSDNTVQVGIHALTSALPANDAASDANAYVYVNQQGYKYNNGSGSSYGATWTTGDVIGVAYDADNGTLAFYKNGTSQGTAYSSLTASKNFAPIVTLGRASTSTSVSANFGQRPFAYTAPSGFKALCTANLPTPTIEDGSTVMDVKLYTGTGGSQTISGYSFSPDLVWIKQRSGGTDHGLFDTVRGVYLQLRSNTTAGDNTVTNALTSFTSDGYVLGGDGPINANGLTYVNWAWDAGSSTVSNTQGSITSQVRANASAGFSVVTYTGTGSAATVGHGLGVAPGLIILKDRTSAYNWQVYHSTFAGTSNSIVLNSTAAVDTGSGGVWNSTAPTSTVFSIGTSVGVNTNGNNYVAYCFAPVAGYSSFGSYTGNGSADGPFVFTGMRPRWILLKSASIGNESWIIIDTARSTYNVVDAFLRADNSGAEFSSSLRYVDILSNGFKLRASGTEVNGSGGTYVYAAFAENPFKYARAR